MTAPSPDASQPLTSEEEDFLRVFARAMVIIPRAFDEDLFQGQGMTTSDYFALMYLSEAPEQKLRMGDLAEACSLSLSGLTRVANRLEKLGLIRRERSAEDGRSRSAVLTDAGLQRLQQAWPTHLASVRRHVFDHIDPDLLPAFARTMNQITRHISEEVSGPGVRSDGTGRA